MVAILKHLQLHGAGGRGGLIRNPTPCTGFITPSCHPPPLPPAQKKSTKGPSVLRLLPRLQRSPSAPPGGPSANLLGGCTWGAGFRDEVWGLRFRVWGLGFRAQGSGFRVQGSGLGLRAHGYLYLAQVNGLRHTASSCLQSRCTLVGVAVLSSSKIHNTIGAGEGICPASRCT